MFDLDHIVQFYTCCWSSEEEKNSAELKIFHTGLITVWCSGTIILPLKCNFNNIIFAKIWLGNNVFVSLQRQSTTVVHNPKRNPSQSWSHNWPIVKVRQWFAKSLAMIFARSGNFEVAVKTFPCEEAIHRAGKYTPLNQSLTQVIYTMGRVEKYSGKAKNPTPLIKAWF